MKRVVNIAGLVFCMVVMLTGCNGTTEVKDATLGNTSGNISAGGTVVEDAGWIYFDNPRDFNKLYKMKADRSEVTKLSEIRAAFLNVWGEYIIYVDVSNDMVYKIKKDGTQEEPLISEKIRSFGVGMVVADNFLYYSPQSDEKLYRMSLTDSSKELISEDKVTLLNANERGLMYLAEKDDAKFQLVSITFEGLKRNEIAPAAVVYPVANKEWIYFAQGENADLYRVKLLSNVNDQQKSLEKVGNIRAGMIHVYGDNVYYLNLADNYRVYKADLKGSNQQKISNNAFFFSIVSNILYCMEPLMGGSPFTLSLNGEQREVFLPWPLVDEVSSQSNQPTLLGNLQINQSQGILVSDDTHIFTSLAKNGRQLVKSLPDGSDAKILVAADVRWLNQWEDWIYYINTEAFYAIERVNKDGSMRQSVAEVNGMKMKIVGNWIYYIKVDDFKLYKIRVDGREESLLSDIQLSDFQIWIINDEIRLAIVDRELGHLIHLSETGEKLGTITERKVEFFTFDSDWIYYKSNDDMGNWEFRKVRIDGTDDQLFNEDLVSEVGVYQGNLYYFNGVEEEGIIKLSVNNKNRLRLVQTGNYGDFAIAFGYFYFMDNYSDNYDMYRVKLDGTDLMKLK
jgi:hypothetical protein